MAHEEQTCSRCFGAGTVPRCDTPDARPVVVDCADCSGRGITWAFVYAKAAPNLRKTDDPTLLWLSWWGTPRERKAADKELAKRNGDAR